ncbi:hypothetical protein ABZ922_44820 [Streptomyces shenzhenensis]|uniref:hypothetical protein n=1 Tax=Streptomyces shenzhenensis TaxID=943815 RepID=UPI0033C5BD12
MGQRADFMLLATTTPDYPCPATVSDVACRLGLGQVPAVDVAAVCSGFLYGLDLARASVETGTYARPLVIGAEVYTSIIDPLDRTTSVVCADGAGAVLCGVDTAVVPASSRRSTWAATEPVAT